MSIQASCGSTMILQIINYALILSVNLHIMHSDLWNAQCTESSQISVVTMTTNFNVTRNLCLKYIYIYIICGIANRNFA